MKMVRIAIVAASFCVAAHLQAQTLTVTNTLKLWLKADAGVTQSGGSVSAWADQSGNGFNSVAPNAGAEPTFVASDPLLAGKPTLRFDGSSDYLQNTTFNSLQNVTGFTAFWIARPDTITPNQFVFESPNDASRSATYQFSSNFGFLYAGGDAQAGGSYGQYAPGGGYTTAYTMAETVYDGTQSTDATRLRGFTNAVPVTFSAIIGGIPSSIVSTYSGYTAGARHLNANTFYDGDLAEVLIYDTTLSTTDRRSVEEYIFAKYGIPEPTSVMLLLAGAALLWRRSGRME